MAAPVVVVYVDGSFFEQGGFAGSGVYFGSGSPLNLVQYVPADKYGKRSALLAEMYAAVLATRQAHFHGIRNLVIKQDCKEAIKALQNAPLTCKKSDQLLQDFLYSSRYVSVTFEWVKSHQELAGGESLDVLGNHEADRMAKLGANLTRYQSSITEMDAQNPLLKPFPSNSSCKNGNGTDMDRIEQFGQEAIDSLPVDVLTSMCADRHLRTRMLACHSRTKTLFARLC